MGSEWFRSAQAARAIGYLTDPRPAWLWSSDGKRLLWRNPAARLFRARIKKHKLKLAPPAEPIKGLVPRLMRLGTPGRASLSRIQFIAGGKPISATCTATPLTLVDDRRALLIVGVDPVEKALMSNFGMSADIVDGLFAGEAEFLVSNHKGEIIGGTADRVQTGAGEGKDIDGRPGEDVLEFAAGPGPATVRLFVAQTEPLEPLQPEPDTKPEPSKPATPETPARRNSLTSLLDELSQDEALFTPLGPEDDAFVAPAPAPAEPEDTKADWAEEEADAALRETVADSGTAEPDKPELWRITARGFQPDASGDEQKTADASDARSKDAGTSRYNFDQLSRILTDRIGNEARGQHNTALRADATGALVNLSDETLVLNRLSLGLLIFRDQEILFANRALTDLIRYPDTDTLRRAGLSAIFPLAGDDGEPVGAVTQLITRDGTTVSVSARLQSITWQGSSAFMLTARAAEARPGTEAAVRAFAETLATLDGNGFFETSRAAILDAVSGRAAELFARTPDVMIGRPLMLLVGHHEAARLREFLDQPARFAETTRPSILLEGIDPALDILLFAEGQAGIVTGYFGIVRRRAEKVSAPTAETGKMDKSDTALLGRLTRGVRRPLNTIIGFSELIRTNAFGEIQNERYLEYARDIKSAGQDIADIIDEIEEYARLNDENYQIAPADFDLGMLLQKCLSRVRHQAGEARVLVRSAFPDSLPQIKADEASLGQAILNLLASAIEQTPQGGQVVISAHPEDNGDITIHLRDSGQFDGDLAERFVVFRDGTDEDGVVRRPVPSSVGLALTRSLLAVNTCKLSIDPTAGLGTLFNLVIPAALVASPDKKTH